MKKLPVLKHIQLLVFVIIFISQNARAQVFIDSTLLNTDSIIFTNVDSLFETFEDSIPNDKVIVNVKKKGKQVVEGVVKDFTTNEPISFATIFFPGTSVGKRADINGAFRFEFDFYPSDSLYCTTIGYAKAKMLLDTNASFQKLKIEMERASVQMREFVVKFDKDPALTLMKKVIKAKPLNDYDKATNYSYEVYNKLEMDINKIPKKSFSVSPILKNLILYNPIWILQVRKNHFFLCF